MVTHVAIRLIIRANSIINIIDLNQISNIFKLKEIFGIKIDW